MAKLVVVSTALLLLFISLGDASCPVCSPYYHHPKHPPKSHPPKFKPPKPPVVGPKPPPIVQPPTRPVPPIVRPPPVVVPPPIISPPKRPPIVKPPFPPIVRPKPPLPPKHNKPCPPPPPPPYLPPPAPHPPPPATATCPIDTLRLGACVDLLGGLVHTIIGNRVRDTCCPVLQGLADLDAAVCLCTTIRLKLLNISLVLPIALELLIDCGKTPPPGYKCPV